MNHIQPKNIPPDAECFQKIGGFSCP